jgi:hypothetical protein
MSERTPGQRVVAQLYAEWEKRALTEAEVAGAIDAECTAALAQVEKTIASVVFNLEATQRNQADAILARRRAEDALAAAEAERDTLRRLKEGYVRDLAYWNGAYHEANGSRVKTLAALEAAEARAERIRQETIEECVRVADSFGVVWTSTQSSRVAQDIAREIRALADAPGDRGECRHSGFLEARLHDGTGEVWRTCTDCGFRWEAAPAPRDPEQ